MMFFLKVCGSFCRLEVSGHIGAEDNDNNDISSGHVRVYYTDGTG
jgi:hypothetical protein